MPFFDFHIHPVLKSQFSSQTVTTNKFSPWEKLRKQDIPFLLRWCTEFRFILQSQSNLAQLVVNDCNLICAVLYISEKALIDNSLIRSAARGSLSRYIQNQRIDEIINGNPYEILINEDLPTLTDVAQFHVTDRRVKLINDSNEYDEADSSTIHVVFTMEGCHSLCDRLDNFDKETILTNLDDLRSRVRLLSLNPTHLEQSPLCNHAFGIPYFDEEVFKPTGNRISNDCIDIIRHCYVNEILIDVKHMSLAARLHLYQLRDFGAFNQVNPPIVCTHAGFTGLSKDDIPDYIREFRSVPGKGYSHITYGKPTHYGGGFARPSFNPCSINLYDEDILAIINSGGMIGLSLDKRILGYQNFEEFPTDDFPLEMEFVSRREESIFMPNGGNTVIGRAIENGLTVIWSDIEEGGIVEPNVGFQHLRHFMSHILHLIVVTGDNAANALKLVCIGSDFDGLINPIWCCETTDELFHFKQDLKDHFEDFADESNIDLPVGFDIAEFCEDLFFRNGRNFVMNRLDALNA